jgi:hypothetical protein
MSWIKRNLYFLIGTVVALALMGMAGWYLYSKWQLNNQILGDLNTSYAELDRLNNQNPHPGNGKVDNIKAAKEQRQELVNLLKRTREYFLRIRPIPDSPKVSSQEFTTALHETVNHLQHAATNASVVLPADYFFSFAAQKSKVTFATGSLQPLSVQLGEIKLISDILCAAKINSLDNIRRERVSSDDDSGPATDFLSEKSVTNELAILTPYEVTFRCFSSELAGVLTGLAGSPYGLVVKSVNVEQAAASTTEETPGATTPYVMAQPVYTPTPAAPDRPLTARQAEMLMMQRYGRGGGGRYGPNRPYRPTAEPTPPPVVAATPAPTGKGGLQTVLDEKQLKITMVLNVVKLAALK